jgi:Flp pilus assembly protein CpaB
MSSKPGSGGPRLRRLNMGQVFIILAVISAVVTIIIFKSVITPKTPEKVELKTRPLVVATHQLFAGEIITGESVRIVDWPSEHYPQADVYEDANKLIGRAVKTDIYSGEPIYRPSLAGEESQGGLPVVIPRGYRAMTVLVTENKGVGGFVKPGDRVDVLGTFTFTIPDATQKAISKRAGFLYQDSFQSTQTVLQDVLVLATAQTMYEKKSAIEEGLNEGGGEASGGEQGNAGSAPPPPADAPPGPDPTAGKVVSSVTLAVTPEQAEKLALTEVRGDLRLALRPDDEHEQEHLLGASADDIMPLKGLFEKAISIVSNLDPSLLSGDGEDSESSVPDAPPPPPPSSVVNMPPPPGLPPAGPEHNIQVIEGTTTSSVSF